MRARFDHFLLCSLDALAQPMLAKGDTAMACRYWLPQRPDGDFRGLQTWGSTWPANLTATVSGASCGSSRCNATATLNNTSIATVAFWIKLALVDICGADCAPTCASPPGPPCMP